MINDGAGEWIVITLRRGPGQYGVTQIQLHKSRPARELHVFKSRES